MAPGTPKGLRRWALRAFRRHPWLVSRSTTVGNPVDLFSNADLVREFLFSPRTPESLVRSYEDRLEPESVRAARETVKPLPDSRLITVPMLVLGAADDASRIAGDADAVAAMYAADSEIFSGMGHVMMLEPGWVAVAARIDTWLASQGL